MATGRPLAEIHCPVLSFPGLPVMLLFHWPSGGELTHGSQTYGRSSMEEAVAIRRFGSNNVWLGPTKWAQRGSNPRPLVCKTSALPLSYTPLGRRG